MRERKDDLRDCYTAYDCRDRLPTLTSWMNDDQLKQVRIWHGTRFERGVTYFDLDNPDRGPFVATGEEGLPTDHTYVARDEVSENVWTHLVAWREGLTKEQERAIGEWRQKHGEGIERSAAGDARPRPPG